MTEPSRGVTRRMVARERLASMAPSLSDNTDSSDCMCVRARVFVRVGRGREGGGEWRVIPYAIRAFARQHTASMYACNG